MHGQKLHTMTCLVWQRWKNDTINHHLITFAIIDAYQFKLIFFRSIYINHLSILHFGILIKPAMWSDGASSDGVILDSVPGFPCYNWNLTRYSQLTLSIIRIPVFKNPTILKFPVIHRFSQHDFRIDTKNLFSKTINSPREHQLRCETKIQQALITY